MNALARFFLVILLVPAAAVALRAQSAVDVFLTSLNAAQDGNTVSISWTTASESNCDYFTVERTKDGVNYEMVGTVPASGASSQPRAYSMADSKPENGVNYYRLKGVSATGFVKTFSPVAVTVNIERSSMSVYPNPATNDVVHVMIPEGGARLEIRSARGKLLMVKEVSFSDGAEFTLDLSTLREGNNSTLIFISVYGADFTDTKTVVLQ